jgi:hypothetical protein
MKDYLIRRMIMAKDYRKPKKKPVGKLALFGICTGAAYAALLMNQALVTAYFTKGALYALLPIATAFCFSFLHGNFTSLFWTVLGVEARKGSVVARKTPEVGRPDRRERPQPRPRLRAKV